jgi:hypothetical protein
MRGWGVKLLLALFGVAIALILAEVAFRITGMAPLSQSAWDYSRGWQLQPGASGWQRSEGHAYVTINREGLRGPEVPLAKPPDTVRIAVLGDSFTEALHVPYQQSFCAVAERALNRCGALGGRRAQVIDFGVSGYGTAQELLTLREKVWRYSPDIVVLAICTGNDVSDNSSALDTDSWLNGERCRPYFANRGGKLVETSEFRDSLLPHLWCRSNFALRESAIVRVIGDPIVLMYSSVSDRFGSRAATPVAGHEPGLDDQIYSPPQTWEWNEAWNVTDDLIAETNCEVAAHGARFLAVTLSNPVQDYPDAGYRANYLKAVSGTDIFYPEHRIIALGSHDGFPVLNLAPQMQSYADAYHAFLHGFPNTKMGEGHFNAQGHKVAGELIAARLCELIGAGNTSGATAKLPAYCATLMKH